MMIEGLHKDTVGTGIAILEMIGKLAGLGRFVGNGTGRSKQRLCIDGEHYEIEIRRIEA